MGYLIKVDGKLKYAGCSVPCKARPDKPIHEMIKKCLQELGNPEYDIYPDESISSA